MKLTNVTKLSQWRKIYFLYKKSFPSYERKPFLLIWRTYRKRHADVWIITQEGAFAGFAITMNAKDLILLDYFAIAEEKRGNGLGSDALKSLQERYRGKRLFLEIESVYAEADNIAERHRRKQFYLNNGMTEQKVMVSCFGTEMELLGYDCIVSFAEYHSVYLHNYGKRVAAHLVEQIYPD